jgi:hypothetical protein
MASSGVGGLGDRDPQRHAVAVEADHEKFQLVAGDFLFLDAEDLADAVRRIDNEITGIE